MVVLGAKTEKWKKVKEMELLTQIRRKIAAKKRICGTNFCDSKLFPCMTYTQFVVETYNFVPHFYHSFYTGKVADFGSIWWILAEYGRRVSQNSPCGTNFQNILGGISSFWKELLLPGRKEEREIKVIEGILPKKPYFQASRPLKALSGICFRLA